MFNQKPMLGQLPDWTRFPQPAALYVMNEGTGNRVYDLSGNGNTGVFTGNTLWKPSNNDYGSAVYMDGVNDGVLCGIGPSLDVTTNFTIIGFVTPEATQKSAYATIAQKGTFRYYLGLDADLNVQIYTNNLGNLKTTGNLIANETSLVAWTHESSADIIYINGEQAATGNLDDPTLIAGTVLGIGIRGDGFSNDYYGMINALMIFPVTLVHQQIRHLQIDPFPWFVKEPAIKLWTPPEDGGIVVLRRRRECA